MKRSAETQVVYRWMATGMWGAAIVSFALVIQALPPITQVLLISILVFIGIGCFFAIKGSTGR